MREVNRPRWAVGLLLVCAVGMHACSRSADDSTLRLVEQHVADREWEQALVLVKEFLRSHPYNAGAHLLLGQCYLHMPSPALDVAEGEFTTALTLYERTGSMGGIAVPSQEQFRAIIHTEMAITYLRALYEAMDQPVNHRTLQWLAGRSLEQTRKARSLYDSGYLKELEHTLLNIQLEPRRPAPLVRQEEALTVAPAWPLGGRTGHTLA